MACPMRLGPATESARSVRGDRGRVGKSACCCLVAKSCPTLCNPMDCSPPGSSVHGFFRQEYWGGLPFASPGDLPDPGLNPRLPYGEE